MMSNKRSAEKTVRDIRRATRRHYSAEEKIRSVLKGLRGEDSISDPLLNQMAICPVWFDGVHWIGGKHLLF